MSLSDQDKAELRALLQQSNGVHAPWEIEAERPNYLGWPFVTVFCQVRDIGQNIETTDAELICWLVNHAQSLLEE